MPARATQIQKYYPAAERTNINRQGAGWLMHRCQTLWCRQCCAGLDAGMRGCVLCASGLCQATAALGMPPHQRAPLAPPLCSGHCPHDDTPELVNTQLTRWLAQLPAETA